jgi:DNA helicase II / ATP-dependent DNA helicase PcrA
MNKKAINALRFGLVPNEYLREITIGFQNYENMFNEIIDSSFMMHFALGPYGSGKSHLLNCIGSIAKENKYLVSKLEVDSVANISLNRPKYLFSEIWYNLEHHQHVNSSSFTHAFSDFIDRVNFLDFQKMIKKFNLDGTRLISIYKAIMILRNFEKFYDEIDFFDSVFLSEDEFTQEFAQNELFELFKKERIYKNFLKENIKSIIGNFNNSATNDMFSAIYFISEIAIQLGYNGLFILIDEFIFDCAKDRKEKTKEVLEFFHQFNGRKDCHIKFLFAIANDPLIDAHVSEVLEGFVTKKNIHKIHEIHEQDKLILGRKLEHFYNKAYEIPEKISDDKIKNIVGILKGSNSTNNLRSFIKNMIYFFDRKYYDTKKPIDDPNFEQIEIIKAKLDSKILVEAAPGRGKTYTLIERVKYLLNDLHVEPEKILMIFFSRAAVAEVKNRLHNQIQTGKAPFELYFVEPRTFDSYATLKYIEAYPRGTPEYDRFIILDYDQRIKAFISSFLKGNIKLQEELFLVDEIQDLVGIRAEMLFYILEKIKLGVFLFGDICQSIMDFSAKDMHMKSREIFDKLKNMDVMILKELRKSFRFNLEEKTEDELKCMDDLRLAIKNHNMDLGILMLDKYLNQYFKDIKSIPKDCATNSTYLSKTNFEVLLVSKEFHQLKIPHIISKNFGEEILDHWVAQLFGSCFINGANLNKPQFIDQYETLTGKNNGEEIWGYIADLTDNHSNASIMIEDIIHGIMKQKKLDKSFYCDSKNVSVVSTIHKFKGREADDIILCSTKMKSDIINNLKRQIPSKQFEECKVYYVGITRAREKNYFYQIQMTNRYPFFNEKTERWGIKMYGGKPGKPFLSNIEINIAYAEMNTFMRENRHDFSRQEYISLNVFEGDSIELEKINEDFLCYYKVFHIDQNGMRNEIGNMKTGITCNSDFSRYIHEMRNQALGQNYRYNSLFLPNKITDIFVENIESYIGVNLKNNLDIWKTVRFSGMGKCCY